MKPSSREIANYYETHSASVSSPFGGIETRGSDNAYLSEVLSDFRVDLKGRDVLDVGCGGGWFARYCGGKVKHYIGMDITAICAKITKGVAPHVVLGTAESLPFRSGVFDYVFCIDSFEHIPDQERATAEVYRVLKADGKVFLSVPNYSNICGLVKKFAEGIGLSSKDSWAPFDHWTPQVLEHFMTPGKIRHVFDKGGFARFRMIGGRHDFIDGVFPWIDHKFMVGERVVRKLFSFLETPLTMLFPWLSLHTFWLIEK